MDVASPDRNVHLFERLFRVALCVAERIESALSSMPAILSNLSAKDSAKRPAPQYASTRCVGGFVEV